MQHTNSDGNIMNFLICLILCYYYASTNIVNEFIPTTVSSEICLGEGQGAFPICKVQKQKGHYVIKAFMAE